MTIYKITCVDNGMMYIGKTNNIKVRKASHLAYLRNNHHQVQNMQNDFIKYGESSFVFETILKGLHQKTAAKLEEILIDTIKCLDKSYNTRIGAKIDKTMQCEIDRIEKTKETQQSTKYRQTVSERMQKLAQDPEWRKRNSESKKGRVFTEEHKNKLSQAHLTEEYKNKMCGDNSPKAKKVKCIENGIIYGSIKSAAEDLNLWASNIRNVIKGRYKKTGGYTFKEI